jgi:hypothetical protein
MPATPPVFERISSYASSDEKRKHLIEYYEILVNFVRENPEYRISDNVGLCDEANVKLIPKEQSYLN